MRVGKVKVCKLKHSMINSMQLSKPSEKTARVSEERAGRMAIELPSPQPLEKTICRILAGSFKEDAGKKETAFMCVYAACMWRREGERERGERSLWGHHLTLFVMHILN
jgi:hypothetical protein